MKLTKKQLVITISIVILLILGGGGLAYHNQQVQAQKQEQLRQSRIDKAIAAINKKYKDADSLDTPAKIARIEALRKDLKDYKKGKYSYAKVIKVYNKKINQLVKSIKEQNIATYNSLNITDEAINKASNQQVNQAIATLNSLVQTIKDQKDSVYNGKNQSILNKVNILINKYKSRLDTLNKEAAAATAAKKQQTTTPATNNAPTSSSTPATNNGPTHKGNYGPGGPYNYGRDNPYRNGANNPYRGGANNPYRGGR